MSLNYNDKNRRQNSRYYSSRQSKVRPVDDWERYNERHEMRRKMRQDSKNSRRKRNRIIAIISISVAVVLLAAVAWFALFSMNQAKNLKSTAKELKAELFDAYENIKHMDPQGASESIEKAKNLGDDIREELDTSTFWLFMENVPLVSTDIKNARKALDALDDAYDSIFDPMISQLKQYPMSSLKTEHGFNVKMILAYLDFAEEVKPAIEEFVDEISDITFYFVSSFNLDSYSEKFGKAIYYLGVAEDYDALIRTVLGDGTEDKYYLLLAQNSAEVRACGGFPGSAGSISVTDGEMIIGDFQTIYDVMYSSQAAVIEDSEIQLFGSMYGSQSHDACYNPHFPRMAEISKIAYDEYNGTDIDGVVSMTPAIVQGILEVTEAEVTLSDGTVFNAENALDVIQRDIYLVYQGVQGTASANDTYVGELFSEAASGALATLTDNFGVDRALKYLDLITSSFDDRTVMIWMADEREELVMYDYGCSGSLNYDENRPETGVYVSVSDPSKLGIYMNMFVEVGDGVELSDGSMEYEVKVTLANTMTDENTFGVNSSWVLGNYNRNITGYCYFFAPAGGEIYDIYASDGMYLQWGEYEGLELYYCKSMYLTWYDAVEVTYKVKTSPGVKTQLTVSSTPMLNFHFDSTADLDLSPVGAYSDSLWFEEYVEDDDEEYDEEETYPDIWWYEPETEINDETWEYIDPDAEVTDGDGEEGGDFEGDDGGYEGDEGNGGGAGNDDDGDDGGGAGNDDDGGDGGGAGNEDDGGDGGGAGNEDDE